MKRRAGIRIDAGHRADHGAVRGVLRHRAAGQRRVGRRLVDVGHGDGEGLVEGQAALVGRRAP